MCMIKITFRCFLLVDPRYASQVSLDSRDTSVLVDGHAAARKVSEINSGSIPSRCAIAVSAQQSDIFLTAASDGFLRKWCANNKRLIAKLAVGASDAAIVASTGKAKPVPGIGALEWAPSGCFVACGLSSGDVVLVSPDNNMAVLSR